MDDNFGEWVESMGMASGYGQQEVGVASGWNLWVWLECIGVVSGCCCKEIYRFPHNITYPYFTCISSFFAAASLLLCSLFKCFLFFIYRRIGSITTH